MLNLLSFGANIEIKIELDTDGRQHVVNGQYQQDRVPIYFDGDTLSGSVIIGIKREGKLEHHGIRIELCGITELFADRGNRDEFLCITQDLARPGIISRKTTFPFEFLKASMPFESYQGTHIHLRYFLRVIVNKRWGQLSQECPFIVYCPAPYSTVADEGDKMEVGIEESLHVEIEYNKQKYHLNDVIVGQVCFLLVHVKVKNMELQVIKREVIGSGLNCFSDSEILAKFEIMDGAPVRGEWIPIRLFLGNYPLSPSFRDVNRKFSVRYYLNLVILDEEERRYYKQQEILLYRVQYPSDGICQSCCNNAKFIASAKPQSSNIQPSNDKPATEVHPRIDSNSAESKSTSDEMDMPSGSCRSGSEDVDEANAGAQARDVFAGAGVNEAEQGEQDRQTSDTDIRAADNLIFIGNDSREAVSARQSPKASTPDAVSSDSSDIDDTVPDGFKQTQ